MLRLRQALPSGVTWVSRQASVLCLVTKGSQNVWTTVPSGSVHPKGSGKVNTEGRMSLLVHSIWDLECFISPQKPKWDSPFNTSWGVLREATLVQVLRADDSILCHYPSAISADRQSKANNACQRLLKRKIEDSGAVARVSALDQ